jgi:hypothetical protein
MPKTKVIRLQIEIDEAQMRELESLAELSGVRTKKDLLNNALTLLKWAARQRMEGYSIQSVNQSEGIVKELEMPLLETLAAVSRRKRAAGLHGDKVGRSTESLTTGLIGAKR